MDAQAGYDLRFDWGISGARALTSAADPGVAAVVVDVLSFTTTVTIAVERGIAVHPWPLDMDGARAFARARQAVLAADRQTARETRSLSLSPASFENDDAVAGVGRVVLPSPNGSSIAVAISADAAVFAACLRNAEAVARHLDASGGDILVVAAGERWPDGSLRPAVEDLWGAGAVLAALERAGSRRASPEATAAIAAWAAVRGRLPELLPSTASGRELASAGFTRDLDLAAAEDASDAIPVLVGDAFVEAVSRG